MGGSALNPFIAKPIKQSTDVKLNQSPALANPSDSDSTLKRMIPKA